MRAPTVALAAMLLIGAGPTLPGLGTTDPRHRIDMQAAPWRAVALLQIAGVGRCTAFLVAPTTAVTAAHCLYSPRLGHFVPPGAVHVLTGYDRGAFVRHAVAFGYLIAPGYDPAREATTRGADAAVVQLSAAVIDAGAVLPLADTSGGGTAVMLGGYDQDRPEVIEADTGCRILGTARDGEGRPMLGHDCAATRGSSGAPLLRQTADGWVAVGVQVGGHSASVGGVAVPAAVVRTLLAR